MHIFKNIFINNVQILAAVMKIAKGSLTIWPVYAYTLAA